MSDQEKLYRCMGGKHCNHIPGSRTATNTTYQGRISPAFVDHPPTSNPVVDHETGNTSDKLRDAVDVYLAAGAAYWGTDTSETDAIGLKLAAAVIEADRQANRAALVAEIVEWLRDGAGIGASLAHPSVLQAIEAKWSKL